MRVGIARAASSGTRLIGSAGSTGAAELTLRAAVALAPWATLPQAWHSPHRPTQREVVQPHSEQRYGFVDALAMAAT